jgi:arabinofuranosyltransferase
LSLGDNSGRFCDRIGDQELSLIEMARMAKYRYPALICLILFIMAVGILCFHLAFVQDDAYISFRYAANLLAGNGLVYNAGERVEGFTNFLWVVLLAASEEILGIGFVLTARILSMAAVALISFLLYSFISRFAQGNRLIPLLGVLLLMIANLSIPYWAVSGLETVLFAALVLGTIYCEFAYPGLTFASALVATLIRPEGALVFGIIFLNRFIRSKRIDWRFALYYVIPLIPFAAFKWFYYGSFLPNPFYAKTGAGIEYIKSGLNYLWFFARTLGVYGLIFVPPLLAIRRLWRQYSLLYLFILIYILYIIWVGGDVLKVYRFFVPFVPVLYLLFVLSLQELLKMLSRPKIRPAVGGIILLLICTGTSAGAYLLSRNHIESYLNLEKLLTEKMQFTAGMLKKYMGPDFSVAASTIGMLGYELPGHRIIDMLGLTDKYIARHPEKISGLQSTWQERHFNGRYILEQHPDFILFSTNDKPSAPVELALMLHSEFRRCYSPTAFPRDTLGHWAIIYKRWKSVEINRDQVETDVNFATLLKNGYDFRSKGKYKDALESFQSAGKILKKEYPDLAMNIGEIFYRLKDYDMALQCFQYVISQEPYNWHARQLLARIAQQRGDTATAHLQWREINKTSPWVFDRGK